MNSVFKKLSNKKHKDSHKERNKDSKKDKGELAKTPEPEKNDHTKKKSKDKDKKDEKHHERKLNSTRGSKPPKGPPQPSSDPAQNKDDETEDNLDDNPQNLIQLTPQAATPAPQQSTKRKDSKKKGKEEKDHGQEVPGAASVTGKDSTVKKKKKKDKKEPPENFLAMGKAIEAKTVEDILNEFKNNHKPGCEELNRDTRYVLTFNVPPDSDFYDASRVEMPGIECKFIAAASPTTDTYSMETFWRLVYDANVANIFYLEPAGRDFTQLAHFLPLEPTSSKDYGKMFVNNKKVERNPKEYQAVVEVLPEGCSNSIIVRFIQGRQWPENVGRKYRRIALHMVRTLRNEKSTSLIVCKDGRGKTGQFILLHSAITDVMGTAPDYKFKMAESLAALRQMRWGAIQTEQQYFLMYMLSIDFAACKYKATFEAHARKLEQAIMDHAKKQRQDTAKAPTPSKDPKETKEVKEVKEKDNKKKDKTERTDKTDKGEKKKDKEKEKKKEEKEEEKKEEEKKEKEPDTVKQASEAATQFGTKEPEKESGAPPIVQSLYL